MANMYMKLGDNPVKGAATALVKGGGKISKKGWFAIRSLSWHASRSIPMSIGDGYNRDTGELMLSPIMLTKEMCGASEVLLSRFYVPGEFGDTVDVIITKPSRTGQGAEVYLHVVVDHARIADYNISIADGATPFESLALAYSKIGLKHWNELKGGKLEAGGEVTFDLSSGQAVSHAIKGGGGGGGASIKEL
ncbi:type VI secretion system tube protein Hcp [Endozoicomonas euniceicola]|uniref:Type VI secretion system tube protein Hcp n=1 Tax=Endozoicomonas euniceicola TaxID=1234143 RepID=A0ABY6GQ41_9GAMM|nr:type VI secretion system tube protein Hcp [Endozoicomonas euniceicola]UYM14847.1 type VI secretion system tube protein Hcp [Endozoicomonas euniceicola]